MPKYSMVFTFFSYCKHQIIILLILAEMVDKYKHLEGKKITGVHSVASRNHLMAGCGETQRQKYQKEWQEWCHSKEQLKCREQSEALKRQAWRELIQHLTNIVVSHALERFNSSRVTLMSEAGLSANGSMREWKRASVSHPYSSLQVFFHNWR